MLVYLATPGNQLHAEMMAGCCVLESFALKAKSEWMARYRPTFRSMMLDSGAYSEMTSGKPVDLGAYVDFCLEHGGAYDAIVSLDVIAGDVAERVDRGRRNLRTMRDAGIDAWPVFHQGEPWSVLEEYAAGGKVGLGLQRPMREVERFLDGCFERAGSAKVHGFALASAKYTGRYPFHSVDSATWMHELRALMATKDQASDVLRFLTPGELLRLVVLKYQRLPVATAWEGIRTGDLFDRLEAGRGAA